MISVNQWVAYEDRWDKFFESHQDLIEDKPDLQRPTKTKTEKRGKNEAK